VKILLGVGCFYLFMFVLNTSLILWSVRSGKMTVKEVRAVLFDDD